MAIVRTGMLWPSLVRWLVILIGGSSPEVGARSAPARRKRGACTRKVTGLGAIVPNHRSGWAMYRSAGRLGEAAQRASPQSGSGRAAVGSALAWGEAQVSRARGGRGERGGPGQPAHGCGSPVG